MTRPADPFRVLYVLEASPRPVPAEVLGDLAGLDWLGLEVGIDSLGPPGAEWFREEADGLRRRLRGLPLDPLRPRRGAVVAHLGVAARRPLRWLHVWRHSRGDLRRFLYAGMVADRARREGFGHLHAPCTEGAAEVARDAAHLAGITYSVTARAGVFFPEIRRSRGRRRSHDGRPGPVAAVVTETRRDAEVLGPRLPGTRVVQVPHGVGRAPSTVRSSDGPILCVASSGEESGLDGLLHAVASLTDALPDVVLEIAGHDDVCEELAAVAEWLGILDHCRFVGELGPIELGEALDRCAVLVEPGGSATWSDREAVPAAVLHAMARAVPVVASATVGIAEVVVDDETGLVVPPDDSGSLAVAIEKLLREPDWAAALGRAGQHLVRERMDPARSAFLLAGLFVSCAQEGPR